MSFDRHFITVRFSLAVVALFVLSASAMPRAADAAKPTYKRMDEVFQVTTPLTYTPWRSTPAVAETTIRRQIFFDDLEGSTAGWGVINYRQGQPSAWNVVSGVNSCTGNAWWCGQTGLPFGSGYNNNWIQTLKTNVPITLTGTNNNKLTYKFRCRTEYTYDWAFVMIKDAAAGSRWDTLASYSGDFGASCVNATIDIANSWTTAPQPITLLFLFGSDLDISAGDQAGNFQGWSLDDVKVQSQGNPPGGSVRFFDDMESGTSKWVWESPNPGPLWHLESAPGTAIPANCFFLSSNVWVPFAGSGFGFVPDWVDAMLTSPPMDIEGVFSPNNPTTGLTIQFDDWINLPDENAIYWSLQISGSHDLTNWTPWRNTGSLHIGGNPQCIEGSTGVFDPYDTPTTGIQPGTRYIRLGFRLRDEKANARPAWEGAPLFLGVRTEGIYFDNIGVYNIYTISGVEPVPGLPTGANASIRKAFPNPFNPSTTLELSVPKQGAVAVRIFDLQGRRVATLLDEPLNAGVYRIRWNGQDDQGRTQSSGIYFAQIQSGGSRQSVRLTMLK